jgi:Ca-activated chloride channel family protein
MKKAAKLLSVSILAVLTLVVFSVRAQQTHIHGSGQEENEDRTLSPYFLVRSDEPGTEQLPLKSTTADVNISGVISDVTVTQVYKNEGDVPIEAIYVFPASTRAAVYGMKMIIGKRAISAEIRKRDEARMEYEKAKNEGKSASLLEQHRPNVFQMNVANIMPGDVIEVELNYTELLVPEDRIYEFVYPTVVGPRYAGRSADLETDKWVQNPYLHEGQMPDYTFDINVSIAGGMPVRKIHSPSHRVNVAFNGKSDVSVALDEKEQYGGNRDYILTYSLSGENTEPGLLLYRGEKENYFLLMMQPPERVEDSRIPGREYIFVVDVSGSMHGFPLDVSKELLRNLIGQLRSTDKFNVLLFAGGSSIMHEQSVPASSAHISRAVRFIEQQRGGGGTNILPALKRALALPAEEGYSRSIVIATDGYVAVESQVFDLIRGSLGNANVFAFGIGSSVNRHIIEGMAHAGMGEPFIVTKPGEASSLANKFQKMIQSPVLTDINITFSGLDTYDVEPLSIPDIMAERPVMIFGKWKGRPVGQITLSGTSGSRHWSDAIDMSSVSPSKDNSALRYLWARHRIRILSNYNRLNPDDERVQEVTSLGLTYNLLTAYTSFVAIDSEISNAGGESATVNQPLPLPQGVSDYAVASMRVAQGPAYVSGGFRGKVKRIAPQSSTELMTDARVGESTGYPGLLNRPSHDNAEQEMIEAGKGRHSTTIRIEDITVERGLQQDEIRQVIKQHLKEAPGCFIHAASPVKLKITLVIDVGGGVKDVTIVRGGLRNGVIGICLEKQIKKWQFPVIPHGTRTKVTFVLVFK